MWIKEFCLYRDLSGGGGWRMSCYGLHLWIYYRFLTDCFNSIIGKHAPCGILQSMHRDQTINIFVVFLTLYSNNKIYYNL